MKLQLKALLTLAALLLSGPALALGVGKLELESALNERFEARIPILSATADELSTLRVGLANMEMFRRAGLDRAAELSKLSFKLVETEAGQDYIHITSQEAIREPFLNFLMELSWANGRLYREYTVLLDPPMYDPDIGRMATAPPAPAPTPRSPVAAPPSAEPAFRHDVIYPEDSPRTPRVTAAATYTGGDYGPVREGDTLWSIANAMRPGNVSTHQMMLALLRANPEAFIGSNVNALHAGAILRMPESDELQRMSRAEALAEVERQYGLWEDGRLAMTAAPTERPDTVTPTPATAAVAEDPEPAVVDEIDDSELRLLAATESGEARPGDEEGAELAQLRGDLAVVTEDLESVRQENIELSERLIEAEELVEDLKRLIALKDDELASLQQRMAEEGAEYPEPVAAVEDDDELDPVIAAAEPPTEAPAETVSPETDDPAAAGPDIVGMATGYLTAARDFVMANLVMIGGGLAALIALLVGGLFLSRRRTAAAEVEADRLVAAGEFPDFSSDADADVTNFDFEPESHAGEFESATDAPQADAVDDAEETVFVIPEPEADTAAAQPDEPEEDPLAEVNVLMAYEHFDQAEEFVRKAIAEQPDNLEYHSKLLEVFYAANNKKKYEEAARVLRDLTGGEGEHWDMAVAMWQEISPSRALFEAGGEEEAVEITGGGGIVDITGDTAGGATVGGGTGSGLDFDLSDTAEQAGEASADEGMLDLTAGEEQMQDESMLDLTAALEDEDKGEMLDLTAASGPENDDGSLDFDMTQAAGAEPEPDMQVGGGDDLLDVTRDGHLEMDGGEDLLDITGGGGSEAAGETGDDNSLDFETGLDFDTGAGTEAEPRQADAAANDNMIEFETGLGTQENREDDTALSSLDEIGAELDRLEHTLGTLSGRTQSGEDELSQLDASLASEPAGEKSRSGMSNTSDALEGIDKALTGDDADSGDAVSQFGMGNTSEALDGIDSSLFSDDEDTGDSVSQSGMSTTSDALEGIESSIDEYDVNAEADRLMADLAADLEIDFDADDSTGEDDDLSKMLGTGLDEDSSDDGDAIDLEFGDTDDDDYSLESAFRDSDGADTDDVPEISLSDDDLTLESDDVNDAVEMEATVSPFAGETDEAEFSLDLDGDAPDSDELSIDMDSTVELPSNRMPDYDLPLQDDEGNGEDRTMFVARSGDGVQQSLEDELTTKLDLAKAYVELGDTDSARGILEEVMRDGNDTQKRQAGDLLQQI